MSKSKSEKWNFANTWHRLLKAMRSCLERQHGMATVAPAIEVIDGLLGMPTDDFNKILSEFSLEHRDGLSSADIQVSSELILKGLENEMLDVAEAIRNPLTFFERIRNFFAGGAKKFESVEVVTNSFRDVLQSLPNWVTNSLAFLGEVFKLLSLKGSAR